MGEVQTVGLLVEGGEKGMSKATLDERWAALEAAMVGEDEPLLLGELLRQATEDCGGAPTPGMERALMLIRDASALKFLTAADAYWMGPAAVLAWRVASILRDGAE